MKQFEITVKIRVTIFGDDLQTQYDDAMFVAQHYANMAMKYSSVGADEIVEVKVEGVKE